MAKGFPKPDKLPDGTHHVLARLSSDSGDGIACLRIWALDDRTAVYFEPVCVFWMVMRQLRHAACADGTDFISSLVSSGGGGAFDAFIAGRSRWNQAVFFKAQRMETICISNAEADRSSRRVMCSCGRHLFLVRCRTARTRKPVADHIKQGKERMRKSGRYF